MYMVFRFWPKTVIPEDFFLIDFTPAAAAASRAFVRWRQTPEADALRPALPPSTRSA
jgi:hypothetical protein